mmetsp:Transcript_7582/g.13952  ORF Transcript_7582/g.13952 Transcript_7582/m.13952 type:complete len:94 (-) Transcript_7582:259-540(-)
MDVSGFKVRVANLQGLGSSCDLAYVIYTSGITGKPKGVLQTLGFYVFTTKRGHMRSSLQHSAHLTVDMSLVPKTTQARGAYGQEYSIYHLQVI